LEGEELATAYASADTMVFPSTTDTFGNVVLEAQASGVPVIVTDRGGPADIVRSHNSGLIVDHTCTEAIAEAMEQLFLSPTLRADLRIRGLRNAAESSWQQVLDDLWHSEEDDRCDTTISAYRSSDPRTAPGVITSEVA
jgi:glycosyltransferase involved in cell wall biosynthesis